MLEPFHVSYTIPTGNDQPDRGTLVQRERRSVHLIGDQNLRPHGVPDSQAAREALFDFGSGAPMGNLFHSLVGAEKDHFLGVRHQPAIFKQVSQAGPYPARIPDHSVDPGIIIA
jgi:hypothetical protein